jgi:hypothetical protein
MARTKKKPKGLGDVIENITETTGIKKVVKAISEATGVDCGCGDEKSGRHKWLNELVPFGKRIIQCATDEQKAYLEALFSKKPTQLSFSQQRELTAIYFHSYGINIEQSQCSDCWRSYLNDLKRLVE